ncbi:hypothetical protein LSAT2_018589 [Lamellibrachia satsuma]|nr:hypothetical protein LSAT2_018589 [Lamellibrachia satsuma]
MHIQANTSSRLIRPNAKPHRPNDKTSSVRRATILLNQVDTTSRQIRRKAESPRLKDNISSFGAASILPSHADIPNRPICRKAKPHKTSIGGATSCRTRPTPLVDLFGSVPDWPGRCQPQCIIEQIECRWRKSSQTDYCAETPVQFPELGETCH